MSQYKLVRFNLNGKDVEKMVDVRASLTDMLRNLDRDDMAVVVDRDGVQQLGQRVSGKFNVKHRSGDLDNGADILLTHWQNSL